MRNIEVKEWLCGLNKEDYIDNLQRLENMMTTEMEEKIVSKKQERQACKSIKRTLRKIKQR